MATQADLARWARRGTTTERGLGGDHKTEKMRQLRVLVDGSPCRRCGAPRYHPDRCPHGRCQLCMLDLGHHNPRIFGGHGPRVLEHRRCNRAAGARLGNHLRSSVQRQSRRW